MLSPFNCRLAVITARKMNGPQSVEIYRKRIIMYGRYEVRETILQGGSEVKPMDCFATRLSGSAGARSLNVARVDSDRRLPPS